jgi:hypothetical protein
VIIDAVSYDIESIGRESGLVTVRCAEKHGLIGVADQYGVVRSDQIAVVTVTDLKTDNEDFYGAYAVDPQAPYNLTDRIATTRESITKGQNLRALLVNGELPNTVALVMFDLNKDTQEGPVRYFGSQSSNTLAPVQISSISQFGATVTVTTLTGHGGTIGSSVVIGGTVNFNGVYVISNVASPLVYNFTRSAMTVVEHTGTSQINVSNAISVLTMDPAYNFKYSHDIGADVNLIIDSVAYEPSALGSDYAPYITGTAEGRVFAQQLLEDIVALGIKIEVVILYPDDVGLGNAGQSDSIDDPPTSDKIYVWGIDE